MPKHYAYGEKVEGSDCVYLKEETETNTIGEPDKPTLEHRKTTSEYRIIMDENDKTRFVVSEIKQTTDPVVLDEGVEGVSSWIVQKETDSEKGDPKRIETILTGELAMKIFQKVSEKPKSTPELYERLIRNFELSSKAREGLEDRAIDEFDEDTDNLI